MMEYWKSAKELLIDVVYAVGIGVLCASGHVALLQGSYFWAAVFVAVYALVLIFPSDRRRDKAEKPV